MSVALATCLLAVGLEVAAVPVAAAPPAQVESKVRSATDSERAALLESEPRDLDAEFPQGDPDGALSEAELELASLGGGPQSGTGLPERSAPGQSERVREVESMRTPFGETYETADGGFVTEMGLEPKRWKDDAGKWREIDTSIVTTDDGLLKNAGGVFDVFFASSDVGVRYVVDGYEVAFSFDSDNVVTPEIDEKDPSTVWYRNIWPGVDASYTVHKNGVKEVFVVSNAEALAAARGFATTWRSKGVIVEDTELGDGLRVDWDRDGKFAMGDNQPFVSLDPLMVQDATGFPQPKAEPKLVEQGSVEGGGQRFVVDLNQDWVPEPVNGVLPDISVTGWVMVRCRGWVG